MGTDPLSNDTDGDGLPDGIEVLLLETDPLSTDTDGDGTPDGAEDFDGDGLTNAEEINAGSSPLLVDGDADGLDDPDELTNGTGPLNPDTDDDGLLDGNELQDPFNTDPLDPDTDDDGILDGNETYTTTTTNESLGTTLETTGEGNAGAGASVGNFTEPGIRNDITNPSRASEFVDVEVGDENATTTVVIEYDESESEPNLLT